MKLQRSDRDVFGAGSMLFATLALVLAMGALVTAGIAYSRSNDVSRRVDKVAASGAIGSATTVTLQEFSISVAPGLVRAGRVTFDVRNVGGMTHELVIVRAASAEALPKVTTAGERSVGAVDEEAIPESDKMGEAGEVKAQGHVTKTFKLPPGEYVVFCNIDNINQDGSVTNHFVKGMHATLTVV
ncbi:MAG: hypothetical protein JJE46_14485 [Acidimicrobiia bacterium]|nr:hypothetical protein [Acidimicrobiia bacterium]